MVQKGSTAFASPQAGQTGVTLLQSRSPSLTAHQIRTTPRRAGSSAFVGVTARLRHERLREMKRLMLGVAALLGVVANAGEMLDAPPRSPDPQVHYVIYLHGAIVTGSNGRPVSEHFGPYEYRAILERLAAPGVTVISEIRQDDADEAANVRRVVAWIDALQRGGVPSRRIAVIGASLGGIIAARVSQAVANPDIRYVLLASTYRMKSIEPFPLHGHVLAIHDEADARDWIAHEYFKNSPDLSSSRQIITQTGLGHALLYQPHDAWVVPALEWIR